MIRQPHIVRYIAQQISCAADGVLEAYQNNRVEEEPQITDRIVGAIEERVRSDFPPNISKKNYSELPSNSAHDPRVVSERMWTRYPSPIVWKARSLRTSSGRAAEEKRHGADLMGVLDIDLPNYRTTKGFLAQAKLAEPRRKFPSGEWERLQVQCEKMLSRTPDSFVWVYSKKRGIRIFSAASVVELTSKNIFDLYDRSVSSFFELHLECFIGDRRLNSTDIDTLDALDEQSAKTGFELSIRSTE